MRSITKFFLLLAVALLAGNEAKAQAKIDFETLGHDWSWTLFENGTNDPTLYSVVANPSTAGINTSAHCAKYVVNANGQPWAGLWSSNLGNVTFTADNCKVKVMVYKDVISNFDVKFENADASVAFEKLVANTKVNEWEELTFDFTAQIGKSVSKLVIIPDFPSARSVGSTNYWDNISFTSGGSTQITAPTVAAPTPTRDASKVISIFSNAYTDVANTNFAATWGQTTAVSTVDIAGNATLKYDNLNYQGTELASPVDASAMNYLHVDVWTPNETSLQITPISPGQEKLYALTPLKQNEWNSYDIPLSAFDNVVFKDLFQFKVVGTGGTIVYLDNLYLYNQTQGSNGPATVDFETVGQDWAWTLFENGTNDPSLYSVVANPSAAGINTSAHCAKYVVNANGQPWAGLWSANLGSVTLSADNCMVKVMVYKDVVSNFDVKFENADASVAFEKLVANTKVNEWEELTFDFTDQIGKSVSKLVLIPDFPSARSAGSINYWDNISFNSKSSGLNSVTMENNLTVASLSRNQLLLKSNNEIAGVVIRNMTGQSAKASLINGLSSVVNLSNLSSGCYLVTVKFVNGRTVTRKIVKQ